MQKKQIKAVGLALCLGLMVTACGQAGKTEPGPGMAETGQPVSSSETAVPNTDAPNTDTPGTDVPSNDAPGMSTQEPATVEYEGNYYLKSEISEKTLRWLEHYHSLSEEDRRRINSVPPEFAGPPGAIAMETNAGTDQPAVDLLLTSAPEVKLVDPLSSAINEFPLQSGNYQWSVQKKTEVEEMVACGSSPLDAIMENADRLKVARYSKLDAVPYSFSCVIPPDQITVTMWDVSNLGDTEAEAESVTVYENHTLIDLAPGKVYELTAEWSREKLETRGFSGTASYAVITE